MSLQIKSSICQSEKMKLQLFILCLVLSIWSQQVLTLKISTTTESLKSYRLNPLKSWRSSSQSNDLPTAYEICQQFFQNPDPSSHYSSDGCGVECLVGSKWEHLFDEDGLRCPFNPYGTCQNEGRCYSNGLAQLGFLDIQFVRGEFNAPANYYVAACIRNSSEPWPEPLNYTICTTHCSSKPIFNQNPVWNQVCTGSGQFSFVNTSRIFFEVFDHQGQGNNHFISGSSASVLEILQRGDSGKVIHFNLDNRETIYVRVTFTKKNFWSATGYKLIAAKGPIASNYHRASDDKGYGIL